MRVWPFASSTDTPMVPPPVPIAPIASAALEKRLPMTWLRITRLPSTRCGRAGKLKAIDNSPE